MIDFHTHILPRMDDGSRNVAESIAMLTEEFRQGITDVVLTPHYYADEGSPSEFLARRSHAWQMLKPRLTEGLPRIYLGAEVQYFEGICAVDDICCLRIEGTNFLLLEMPFCRWTDRMINDVLELNDRPDIRIVLAHIERYLENQTPEVWKKLQAGGVLMQSNVSFFADWKTRLRAMRMLSKGEISFLGSDCHNMKYRKPNWIKLPEKAWTKVRAVKAYKSLLRELKACSEL